VSLPSAAMGLTGRIGVIVLIQPLQK